MAQVATKAGVHPTTVSLALRNHPSIPPATRQRIEAIARDMGYRPDPALCALAAYRHAKTPRRAEALAYLTCWPSEWGWRASRTQARYHAGALARASELGYSLEHFWLGAPGLSHRRMSDILYARGITGVIVAAHPPGAGQPLALDWSRFSGVRIDASPRLPRLPSVTSDQRVIMCLAIQRILSAGYRRVGLVLPRGWDEGADFAWSASFVAGQHSIPVEDRIPMLVMEEERGVRDASPFGPWMARHRPETLISPTAFVRPHLQALGLEVPRDVGLVDLWLEDAGGTAGVCHNCERIGAVAVDLLARQLQENELGIPECGIATLVEGNWCDGFTLPLRAMGPRETEPDLLARTA